MRLGEAAAGVEEVRKVCYWFDKIVGFGGLGCYWDCV